MKEIKKSNLTKKEIVLNIQKKTGLPNIYLTKIVDSFIEILKLSLKEDNLNIKNFGTFKIINKKERLGRNPKNKKIYKVSARKSISFSVSNFLKKKID